MTNELDAGRAIEILEDDELEQENAAMGEQIDAERAAFEAWYAQYVCVTADRVKTWRSGCGYREEYSGACSAWEVWQARASLPVGVPQVTPMGGYDFVDASLPAAGSAGKYSSVLRPFVAMMEAELHANSGKGDRPGWLAMSPEQCLLEIYYHTAKLQKAVKNNDMNGVREYTADVANMSMMLADICGWLDIVGTEIDAQQSAPERVSVPVELIVQILRDVPETNLCAKAFRTLLASHGRGEA